MKKILFIISVILCMLVILSFPLLRMILQKPAPLVEGLYWESSPRRVSKVLGAYEHRTNRDDLIGKYIYEFNTVLFGQETEITCFFWRDRYLTDIYFTWEDSSEDTYKEIYSSLYSHFCDKENFYINKQDGPENSTPYISIGVDNGATGIHCTIHKNESTITVSCINLK